MFAGYDGALAEAQRACYALRPNDALRRKIEPELRRIPRELRKFEAGREDEALLYKPHQTEWKRLARRAPARDAALREAALTVWNAVASLLWGGSSTTTERMQRKRRSPVYRCNEHMRRTWRRFLEREDALDLGCGRDSTAQFSRTLLARA